MNCSETCVAADTHGFAGEPTRAKKRTKILEGVHRAETRPRAMAHTVCVACDSDQLFSIIIVVSRNWSQRSQYWLFIRPRRHPASMVEVTTSHKQYQPVTTGINDPTTTDHYGRHISRTCRRRVMLKHTRTPTRPHKDNHALKRGFKTNARTHARTHA